MTQKLRTVTMGNGPDLVLLHGWGLNSGVWENLMPKLTSCHTVTLVDLPGFGLNHNTLPLDYDLPSVAKLVADVVPNNSVILGWSLGGLIAQHIAAMGLLDIKQLILLCTSPKFEAADEWPGIQASVLSLFHKQLGQDFNKTLERFLAIQAMGSQSARSDIRQLKHSIAQYPVPHKTALSGGLALLSDIDLRADLAQITIPTTWFFGRLDSLVPQKAIALIKQYQPTAKHVVMQKASHAPFVSHPDDFIEMLLAEIRRDS
jgi:pimeloyl-[acyl-carrier protein] methyl ester esterase